MDWNVILDAMSGRTWAIGRIVRRAGDERAALTTLLLLEETPHPTAALVAVATIPGRDAPPIQAALAPHVGAALAAWRADPQWPGDAGGAETRRELTWGVASLVGFLHAHPAALRAAVDIVRRDGDSDAVAHGLAALGADGWRALGDGQRAALLQQASVAALVRVWDALDDAQRAALLARAAFDDLGPVWDALTDAQRAAAVLAASSQPSIAARLIGRIGAAAWRATDPALRERLIAAAGRDLGWVFATAPAWAGMTEDERETLARAVITQGAASAALNLLDALGAAGRQALSADLRALLEVHARTCVSFLKLRAADAGWNALTDGERGAVLAATERNCREVPRLLRAIGAAGWNAMRADERKRLAVAVRHAPDALFACPPAFWPALAGAALPPATEISWDDPKFWRAEDADADLGGLPPAHQTLVLALAPWRTEDAASDSARIRRLRAAWDALPDDERVALATTHPSVLATVAAAAHLAGGASAAAAAVGASAARFMMTTDGADAKRVVGAMLRDPARWRSWMIAFVPTSDDPPDVREAWRDAAQRGLIADVTLCARLAASPRESGPRHPRARRTVTRRADDAPSS